MEKEKKGLLKGLISNVTGAAKKVPAAIKSVSDKVGSVMAAPGLALSNKLVKTIEGRRNIGSGNQSKIVSPLESVSGWKSNNPAYNKAEKNNTLGRGFGEPAGTAPVLKKLIKKASK